MIKIVRWIPFGFSGITIYPFIFIRYNVRLAPKLIRHEMIHIYQQRECLFVPFFIIYAIDFLCKLAKYRSFYSAYRNIGFEREAYDNDMTARYFKRRKLFAWVRYVYVRP